MITAYTWAQEQKANAYKTAGKTSGRPMSTSDRQAGAAALKQRLERRRRG